MNLTSEWKIKPFNEMYIVSQQVNQNKTTTIASEQFTV